MDIDPVSRDLAIRTVIGEAADQPPEGQAAVASVIKNRVLSGKYGDTARDVVLSKGQFEPWQSRPRELMSYSAESPQYQNAANIVQGVFDGSIPDFSQGATHFYAPVAQRALGRSAPNWSRTPMVAQVGGHNFYAPEGRVMPDQDDLLGKWGTQPASAPSPASAAPTVAEDDLLGKWGAAAPQQGTVIDIPRKAFPGEVVKSTEPPKDETPAHFVNRLLAEHQGPGVGEVGIRLGLGGLRGVGDVADTLGNAITGAGRHGAEALASTGVISPETAGTVTNWANTVQHDIAAERAGFERAAANSPAAQVGRFGGQIAATGPFVEALPVAAAAGPVSRAVLGGAGAGGTAAALTSSVSDEPLASQIGTGALAGGALAPIGLAASALGRGVKNAVFGRIDPETAQLAAAARNQYGIPVTAGQISASPAARFADSVLQRLPFSGYGGRTVAQQTGLNRAVANEMGIASDKITPDVVTRATKSAYADYDAAKSAMTGHLNIDNKFYGDLQNVHQNAHYVLEDSLAKKVDDLLKNVLGKADLNSHTLDADLYQTLTRKNGPLDSAINSRDSRISTYAGDIKNALESLVNRNDPNLKRLKDAADYKYFVAKSVEPLALESSTGNISAAKLLRAVDNSQTNVGELGRIAKRFMKEPPSSGTAERLLTYGGLGTAAGALYNFDPEDFQRNAALAGLTLGLGRGASSILRSNALANSMIRHGLGISLGNPLANFTRRAAPAAALLTRPTNLPSGPFQNPPGQ